jgi:nucleotide-binding universal stress UspA family protein
MQMSSDVILVGVDGSSSSIDALHWAARQATLTGAQLQVVAAWHYPVSLGWAPAWPDDWDPAAEATTGLKAVVDRELAGYDGLKITQKVVEGHPAEILVALALADDAVLLVVGSRGHGAFSGMLLGSVSEHCAAAASCPVVVVRHRHGKAQGTTKA